MMKDGETQSFLEAEDCFPQHIQAKTQTGDKIMEIKTQAMSVLGGLTMVVTDTQNLPGIQISDDVVW